MRCPSCEMLLERYREGSLPGVQQRAVRAHLSNCLPCRQVLERLPGIDALLSAAAPVPIPQNFTFATMAEVRAAAAPHVRPHALWRFLAVYVLAAWGLALAVIAARGIPMTTLAAAAAQFARANHTLQTVASALASLSAHVPFVPWFASGVLALDAAAAIALFAYLIARPHLVRRIHRGAA